jgi:bifunctional DNA-binding transcriptional regulator/antitoxin component of YhaV-PrlF toxin-antitoxin module
MVINRMTDETIMRPGGRILLPPAVLERMGWSEGSVLDLVETPDGVLLRSRSRSVPHAQRKAKPRDQG